MPRTGIEPVTKRISLSGCCWVPLSINIRVFSGTFAVVDAYGMSVIAVVFG